MQRRMHMFGIKCRDCDGKRCAKPYITAYEIAVKHGFQGTEEEWINTLECIYTAKVVAMYGQDNMYWESSDQYASLVAMSQLKELHLQTLDGKIAFLNGIVEGAGGKVTFCTTTYETDDGTFYDKYELYESNDGMYSKINVSSETGVITIDRLAAGIQASLGKADSAYQKPPEGIRFEHLQQSVQEDIQTAPIIYINLITVDGVIVIDTEHTDLHGYNNPLDAITAGADVRIAHTGDAGDGSPYIVHPFTGMLSGSLVFSGPEVYLDDGYAFRIGTYILTESGGATSITKYTQSIS
jgi:hypothetical protein